MDYSSFTNLPPADAEWMMRVNRGTDVLGPKSGIAYSGNPAARERMPVGPMPNQPGFIDPERFRDGAMPKLQAALSSQERAEIDLFERQRSQELQMLGAQLMELAKNRALSTKDKIAQRAQIMAKIDELRSRPVPYADRPFLSPSERRQMGRPSISSYDVVA